MTGVCAHHERDVSEAEARYLPSAPYSAFGHFSTHQLELGQGTLEISFLARLPEREVVLLEWIRRSAVVVTEYLSRLPSPYNSSSCFLAPVSAYSGCIGVQAGRRFFVRVRAGMLTATRMWKSFMEDMPRGLPRSGDRGLQHALRGRLHAGGSSAVHWPLAEVFRIADAAVGVPVLHDLYEQHGLAPAFVDLQALWRDLGIIRLPEGTFFNDSAKLAHIRHAIVGRE